MLPGHQGKSSSKKTDRGIHFSSSSLASSELYVRECKCSHSNQSLHSSDKFCVHISMTDHLHSVLPLKQKNSASFLSHTFISHGQLRINTKFLFLPPLWFLNFLFLINCNFLYTLYSILDSTFFFWLPVSLNQIFHPCFMNHLSENNEAT